MLLCRHAPQVLDISFCTDVQDQGLIGFSQSGRTLTWLSLAGCTGVGSEGVLAVARANPGLLHLSVAHNAELVNDECMIRAVSCLKRMRCFSLAGCSRLQRTHHSISRAVARHCEYIEELSLSQHQDLVDDEVKTLLAHCVHLQRLDLSGCRLLTEEGLIEALPEAAQLKKLILHNVPNISDMASLQAVAPEMCEIDRQAGAYTDAADLEYVLGPKPEAPKVKKKTGGARKTKRSGGKKKKRR